MKPYEHKIHYYETDRMGITHHSNYIRIMEEARVYLLDELGWGYAKMEEMGIVSPVVGIECAYKKSTTFDDLVKVYVTVEKCSAFKLVLNYEMKKNDELCFTAKSTHCFLDTDGRPVVIEKKYPELFEKLNSGIVYEN